MHNSRHNSSSSYSDRNSINMLGMVVVVVVVDTDRLALVR